MNVVREINKINERELELGVGSASWHDEYKDSAYIFIGGLHYDLSEGDVITIFSQYGEVVDVNLPRDKETGKTKGFGFLMYEDQRSTVLAVDNLNGATVLERTLRVDHVKKYRQTRVKGEDGEWKEPEEQSLNAKPQMIDDPGAESSASSAPDIDPDDPMRDYLLKKWQEEHDRKSKKSKGKHKDETPEARRARKERKKEKKARKEATKSEGLKGVEALLKSLDGRRGSREGRTSRRRPRSRSPRSPSPDQQARYSDGRPTGRERHA
ncbi:hypothetical protein B0F90DRAFT_1684771 [Multifurca ochricompacta]|uniref:RRM domain-containing protein n=1 Tax=Multifurca ochricompacta TaxID=376703 RepID=A0AAD4QQV5_9AGAM|nr:hypothetical protein B0F90DRAFT_1684771 [Multifurca ochricompacta]